MSRYRTKGRVYKNSEINPPVGLTHAYPTIQSILIALKGLLHDIFGGYNNWLTTFKYWTVKGTVTQDLLGTVPTFLEGMNRSLVQTPNRENLPTETKNSLALLIYPALLQIFQCCSEVYY